MARGIRSTKAVKPTVMKGRFGDVFEHSRKVKRLVGPEIGEEVQGDVEECEEPEHAAKADEVRELEEFSERRNAKGEDEKRSVQSPVAC